MEYLKSAIRLGAVDFIEKPLNLKEISLVLEKAVLRCAVKKGSASHFEPPADGDEKQGLHCSSTIQKALVYIDAHYQDKHISIGSIACASFLSRAYLCSLFKKELNITVNNYVQQLRLEQAKHLLKANENTVSEISAMVGYENPNYFCKLFKAYTQKTPSAYREEMCNDFSLPAVRKEE
ncbi:MAG: DNA-binding response regulator [Oscillospiraceae bacterium]